MAPSSALAQSRASDFEANDLYLGVNPFRLIWTNQLVPRFLIVAIFRFLVSTVCHKHSKRCLRRGGTSNSIRITPVLSRRSVYSIMVHPTRFELVTSAFGGQGPMTYFAENCGFNAQIMQNRPRSNHEFVAFTPELHRRLERLHATK